MNGRRDLYDIAKNTSRQRKWHDRTTSMISFLIRVGGVNWKGPKRAASEPLRMEIRSGRLPERRSNHSFTPSARRSMTNCAILDDSHGTDPRIGMWIAAQSSGVVRAICRKLLEIRVRRVGASFLDIVGLIFGSRHATNISRITSWGSRRNGARGF